MKKTDEFVKEGAQSSYLPRLWRIDKIEANEVLFEQRIKDIFRRHGVPKNELHDEYIKFYTRIRQDTPYASMDPDMTGIATSARARVLDIPDHQLSEFIENDIDMLLRHHVRTFGLDVEMTRKFGTVDMARQIDEVTDSFDDLLKNASGAKAKKIRSDKEQALKDIRGMRDRLRGTYGLNKDPYRPLSRFYRIMKEWNYLSYLGGVSISALPDVVRPIMVEGFLRTFNYSIKPMVKNIKAAKMSAAETMRAGTAHDMVINQRALAFSDLTDMMGRQSTIERALHGMSNAFSLVNLMNPHNAAVKQWTGMVVASRILETADAWAPLSKATISKIDIMKLAKSGIDQPMAERMTRMFYKHGDIAMADGRMASDILSQYSVGVRQERMAELIASARKKGGVFLPNTDEWGDAQAVHHFRSALSQDVDTIIVTPGAADRALWMSTELGGVISQFKGFAMGAAHRVLLSGMQEKQRHTIYGAAMLIAMGLVAHEFKRKIRGDDSDESAVEKKLQEPSIGLV